jgi:hypothetical protein
MPNIVKAWKRAFIYTDAHADVIDKARLADAIKIKRDWKPHLTIDLGDWSSWDMFRDGARDSDLKDPMGDARAIDKVWGQLEPNWVFEGNHDYRIWKAMGRNDKVIAGFARHLMDGIQECARKAKMTIIPFHSREGWKKLGSHYLGHGYRHGVNALRAMRSHMPGSIIQGDLHTDQIQTDEQFMGGTSHVLGGLVDYSQLKYEETKTSVYRRSHGLILMEYREDEDRIWHLSSLPGQKLELPNFKPRR